MATQLLLHCARFLALVRWITAIIFPFRFDIDEKMALPILLRGLSPIDSWINLKFANLSDTSDSNDLLDPQVSIFSQYIQSIWT